jgi:hypothetical protein
VACTAGCTEAVTFKTARGGESDTGSEIAEALGLSATAVERPSSSTGREGAEAEFQARLSRSRSG